MERSASIKAISAALVLFQVKSQPIKKDSVNPFFGKKYASLYTILDAIHTPLEECGLLLTQVLTKDHCLETVLIHAESEEWISSILPMNPAITDPQKQGSAITYARRYAIGGLLSLNIDEDDDGNAASKPVDKKEPEADARPWISEGALNKAIVRIKGGEQGVYEACDKAFKMKKDYREKLKSAQNG